MRKKTIDMIPVLSDGIKAVLSFFSKSRSFPASLVKRFRLILLASQAMSNQAIASQIGLHYNHVATWRNRFLAALPSLRQIEADALKNWKRKSVSFFPTENVLVRRLYLHKNRFWQSLSLPARIPVAWAMK